MVLYETTFFCCLAFYVDVGPRVDGVGMTPSPLTANRWFLFGMATWLSCRCKPNEPNGLMRMQQMQLQQQMQQLQLRQQQLQQQLTTSRMPSPWVKDGGTRWVKHLVFFFGWDA